MKLLHSHFSQLLCRLPAVLVALVVATSIHPVESRASNIKTLRQQPIVMQGNLLRRVGSLALPVPLRMPSGLHPIALADALVDPSTPLSLFGVVISFYPAEEQRVYDWAKSYRLYYGAEAQAQLRHRKALWFVLDDTTPGGLEAIRLPISQMPVSPPVRWSMRGHLSIGQWVLGVEWSGVVVPPGPTPMMAQGEPYNSSCHSWKGMSAPPITGLITPPSWATNICCVSFQDSEVHVARLARTRLWRTLLLTLNSRSLHTACILMFVCLCCSVPVSATLILKLPSSERKNVAHLIATGSDPIDIRVVEIRDRMLVAAILKGSRTRDISILVDNYSKSLVTLIGRKNIAVRKSAFQNRHKLGGDTLTHSFVLEIGKGHFKEWGGPLIWTRSAFRPQTEILAGSGLGPTNPPWHVMSQTFDHDFSMGSVIQRHDYETRWIAVGSCRMKDRQAINMIFKKYEINAFVFGGSRTYSIIATPEDADKACRVLLHEKYSSHIRVYIYKPRDRYAYIFN